MNILELKDVSKSYDGRSIMENIDISIPEKSFVSIVGKSGSGKSTLLNMIGLLESVDSGSIKIKGEEIPKINSRRATTLRRNTINYLFQSYALINDISVRENLMIAMEFVELSKSEKLKQIDEVLEELDILLLRDKKVNTLSGGEQQRVAMARCILKPCELVLADEPTGSLDEKMADIVFDMMKNLRDKYGKTVVLVTHDTRLADKTDFKIDLDILSK